MEDSAFSATLRIVKDHALGLVCGALLAVMFGSMYGRILYLESEIDALDARGCGCVR